MKKSELLIYILGRANKIVNITYDKNVGIEYLALQAAIELFNSSDIGHKYKASYLVMNPSDIAELKNKMGHVEESSIEDEAYPILFGMKIIETNEVSPGCVIASASEEYLTEFPNTVAKAVKVDKNKISKFYTNATADEHDGEETDLMEVRNVIYYRKLVPHKPGWREVMIEGNPPKELNGWPYRVFKKPE